MNLNYYFDQIIGLLLHRGKDVLLDHWMLIKDEWTTKVDGNDAEQTLEAGSRMNDVP